jgi:hypothetical protein
VQQFHHKPIKKYYIDGLINDEAQAPRLKTEYIRLLVHQMRDEGYVPRLDIEPDFTIDFNEKKQYFQFKLSIYATYVGKWNSEWIMGLDGYRPIYTQKNKSKESLQEQESQ